MKTRLLILLAAVLLTAAGCRPEPEPYVPSPTPAPEEAAAPTQVPARTGVTILADGALQAVRPPLPLAFESGGRLLAVHVRAGDQVRAGDLIATLDGTSLQDQVAQAQLSLQQAELGLEDLTRGADSAELAAARASLASARSNLATLLQPPDEPQIQAARQSLISAQQALQDLVDLPNPNAVQSAKANLTLAEMQVQAAQAAYDQVAWQEHAAMTQQAQNLWQATTNYEQAQAEYRRAQQGASEGEIANARAGIAQAEANLDSLQKGPTPDALAAAEAQVEQAQAALDRLLAGATARDIATAEINVAQARLSLESAQRALEQVELVAPAAGTVTAVEAAAGALVGGGVPIVTLFDASQLEFHTTNLSERDLNKIAPGQAALVTLKTYPDDPIEATVDRIGLEPGAPVGDAATFPVILVLRETELDLRPGLTGRAEIHTGE